MLLENPFQLFQAALVIRDVNDHAPEFPMRENATKNIRNYYTYKVFPLENGTRFRRCNELARATEHQLQPHFQCSLETA